MPYARTRIVNPKLGAFFGIFTSAFAGLAILALIFEGLDVPLPMIRTFVLIGAFVLFSVIGLASFTQDQLDYFTSGRRVPDFYAGLGLAMTAFGATGLLGLTGSFFLVGFDALCLSIGGLAGFVVMAVLLAPFFRKFGAYTVPSYLGRRLDSRAVRLTSAGLLAVPMVLILAAELRMGAFAVSRLTETPPSTLISVLAVVLAVTLGAGGMRSLSWSGAAQGIACLIAVVVPVTVVAVLMTNLPLPQLSYGGVMKTVGRGEASLGLPIVLPPALAFDLPGEGLQPIAKRFSDALGSVGPAAFVIAILTTMAGIASAPWLLPRVAATPGVYEARKSLGWATVIFGLIILTIAPAAVFLRAYLIEVFTAPGAARVPEWINELAALKAAAVDAKGAKLQLTDFLFSRDAVLFSLPVAGRLPAAAVEVTAAGVLAIAMAAAGSSLMALGNILAEDVVNGLSWEPPAEGLRLTAARLSLAVAALFGAAVAIIAPTDPMELLLWSLALSGSAAFPVLVLSIWWKRTNAFGALAGLVVGFSVAVLAILAGEGGWMGVDGALAGAFGIPAGLAAAIAVTLVTPHPSKHLFELVRDIRVPGGEILYDREMLLLKRRKMKRS